MKNKEYNKDPQYTQVEIQWADDGEIENVIISSSQDDNLDPHDEDIFFYGLSERALRKAAKNHTLMEGEWYVLKVSGKVYF